MTRSSDLQAYYRTVGATALAADITKGKVAYGADGRIVGTNNLLLLDLFEGAAGTLITAHTPDVNVAGNSYVDHQWVSPYNGGVTKLQGSGYSYNTGTDVINFCPIDVGKADVDISADIVMASGTTYGSQGLVFRVQDSLNFWALFRSSSTVLKLTQYIAGAATDRATPAVTLANSTKYNFRLTCVGDVITGYIDGVQKCTYTSSLYNTVTKHGFMGMTFSGGGTSQNHHLKILDLS
jgi:hypothetical protein